MIPLSKLFEELSSFDLSRRLQKNATRAFNRGTHSQHKVGLALAKKAKQVSPKYQAMRKRFL